MSPSVIEISRLIIFIAVVLPPPDGPIRTQISPAGMVSDRSSIAGPRAVPVALGDVIELDLGGAGAVFHGRPPVMGASSLIGAARVSAARRAQIYQRARLRDRAKLLGVGDRAPLAACRPARRRRSPSATAAASRRGSRPPARRGPVASGARGTRRSRTRRRRGGGARAAHRRVRGAPRSPRPRRRRRRRIETSWSWKPVSLPLVHVMTQTSTCSSRQSCSKARSAVPWRTSARHRCGSAAICATSSRSSCPVEVAAGHARGQQPGRDCAAQGDAHRIAERQLGARRPTGRSEPWTSRSTPTSRSTASTARAP